jgi:hypothetical protein
MRKQSEHVEALGAAFEQEAQFQVPAALEGRGAKFADSKTGVQMGLAKAVLQLVKRQQAIGSFVS